MITYNMNHADVPLGTIVVDSFCSHCSLVGGIRFMYACRVQFSVKTCFSVHMFLYFVMMKFVWV